MDLHAVEPAVPGGGAYGQPVVIVPAPADARYAHLSWPKIVRAADGTLVVGYIAGRFHGVNGEGCPAVVTSTDGGKTFGAPTYLANYDRTTKYTSGGNLALGVAGDGSIVLLAMAYTGNTSNTVAGWRSRDAGKTWQPVDTATLSDSKTGSVFGQIFAVPGKGLAVTGHYRAGSTPFTTGIWIAYSQNHGQSWGAPQRITDRALAEPSLVYANDRVIGLIRQESGTYQFVQTVSTDHGATWIWTDQALPHALPGAAKSVSPCLLVDREQPGRLYAVQAERTRTNTNLPGLITLWTADAATLRWTNLGTLATFPTTLGENNDFGYPWMAQLDAHTWYLVCYCGQSHGANALYGLRLTIPGSANK